MGKKITATEAARVSGRGEKTIRLWLHSGKLPAIKEGHEWAIDSDVLMEICGGLQESGETKNIIDQLRQRIETLEVRVHILEHSNQPKQTSQHQPTKISLISNSGQNSNLLSKGACVRLAGKHGVKENTSDKWIWPEEARKNDETALIFAKGKMGETTRQNWHTCTEEECPCHTLK